MALDFAKYTPDHDLAAGSATEPSCGAGAFLEPMVERLAQSCRIHGHNLRDTGDSIHAWDVDSDAIAAARTRARNVLLRYQVEQRTADRLVKHWVREGDYLLATHPLTDWVLGNPPYVRLENVPSQRMAAYRARWNTMSGRADLYIAFFQTGLTSLNKGGTLTYLCADRWMQNQYGQRLRRLIEDHFSLDSIVTLHDCDVFETRVHAYPAIVTVTATAPGSTLHVDTDPSFAAAAAADLTKHLRDGTTPLGPNRPNAAGTDESKGGYTASRTTLRPSAGRGWPMGKPTRIALAARLERDHPALGDRYSGVAIGIGITTGADAVFLTRDPDTVEPERLLPLATAADLANQHINWTGTYLIDPWDSEGNLIDINQFPRLANHFRTHEDRLRSRHIGKRLPLQWHRTIDRKSPGFLATPKLLVADLRPALTPAFDPGNLYPHHNLFWITSTQWDLESLGGLLMSDYGNLFIQTYAPRMAGGAYRITAQYLRRIRIPALHTLRPATSRALAHAFRAGDTTAANEAASDAYRLT